MCASRQVSIEDIGVDLALYFAPWSAGRSWRAAELRGKSFEDLHRLWWVCLKEKNALMTDRLYYGQVGMEMPDASRVKKVRKTMAKIKRVLWERRQAVDAALQQREDLPKPVPELSGPNVRLKKFGRKYVVPADHAFALRPTKAEVKSALNRSRRKGRYMDRVAKRTAATAEAEAAIPQEVRDWYTEREAGKLKKQSIDDAIGRAQEDSRFASLDADLSALRQAAADEVAAATRARVAARSRGAPKRRGRAVEEPEDDRA
jgi:ribosomal protein L29